jgi:hypothetical protein
MTQSGLRICGTIQSNFLICFDFWIFRGHSMNISDRVNSWLSLIASVGILAGLVLVAIELDQNTDQLRLQLTFQANQKIFENNRDMVGDNPTPTIAKSITDPESLTYEEGLVASSYVLNLLNEMEDRFFIHEAGLTNDRDWKRHIDENIGWTLGNRFARKLWESSKPAFEPEFAQYVDQALVNVDDSETFGWWLAIGFSGEPTDNETDQ